MKQSVLYVRVSPSLAENEDTIESQIQALEERIKNDNNILADKYIDNGWAGDLLARPDLDRLRNDIAQKKFEVLYMFDRSRLARKYWLQEFVLEELEEKGIEVIFLKEPKAENDEDKISQGMKGLFAEYERAKITERTRRGRLFRAKQGLLVGHEAPYGYSYIRPEGGKDRWYEINENEAKIVKLIFHLVGNEGYSVRKIIKKLYELGIKPRDGKDYWASSTLSRLLRREDYIGQAYYNKSLNIAPNKPTNNGYKRHKKTSRINKPREEWIPISVPSIIDKEIFELTQKQLIKNQELSPRNVKRQYLLRGLLYCETCGSRFAGETTRNVPYYRSTLRLRVFPLKKECICGTINAGKIETLTWNEITKLLSNPKLIRQQYERYSKNKVLLATSRIKDGEKMNMEIENVKEAEKRIVDAYSKGVLTIDQIKPKLDQIKSRLQDLEIERSNTTADSMQPIKRVNSTLLVKQFKTLLESVTPELKFELLHLLINQIVVNRNKILISGYIPTEIASNDGLRSITYNRWSSGQSS